MLKPRNRVGERSDFVTSRDARLKNPLTGKRPCRRAAEQRDEVAPFHCPMPPMLPTKRIAHLSYGKRLLRCGLSVRLMLQMGQSLPTHSAPVPPDVRS